MSTCNAIDAVMFFTFILSCFSACGFPLTVFNQRYEAFVNIMFGIGILCPPIYATLDLLLIKTITPNNLLAITRNYIFRKVLRREDSEERLQVNESIEEPLLREVDDNSAESDDAELL